MAAEGDLTASRRRAHRTGGYDRESAVYQDMSRPDMSPHTTENYRFDEGMFDIRRPSSSVVRMSTGNIPRHTGSQPSPVPARRQSTGNTRDMTSSQARKSAGITGNTRDVTSSHVRQTQQHQQVQQTRGSRLAGPQSPYVSQNMRNTRNTINRTSPRPMRVSTRTSPAPVRELSSRAPRKVHWLLPAGVGMIVMILLWIIGSDVLAWGTQRYNDVVYGMPRTYQVDAIVGHGDSNAHPSHFIAINLNHQAVIYELKAGDPSNAVIYKAAFYGTDSDNLDPITLEFKDVNNDHKVDMVVHVHSPNHDQVVFFLNDGKQFIGAKSTDKINY